MKNSCSDTIGNRTRDLSAVLPCPQFSGVVFIMTQLLLLPSMLYFIAHSLSNRRYIIQVFVRLSHPRRDGIKRGAESCRFLLFPYRPDFPYVGFLLYRYNGGDSSPRNVRNLIPSDATFQRTLICSYAYLVPHRDDVWRSGGVAPLYVTSTASGYEWNTNNSRILT